MGLKTIDDLCRSDINFINRQKGSGTRVLLDYWLNRKGISSESISGYDREEFTHTAVAAAVANKSSDVGLGIKALTGVSITALTIYDMCKAVDEGIIIEDIKLLKKRGDKSGTYVR